MPQSNSNPFQNTSNDEQNTHVSQMTAEEQQEHMQMLQRQQQERLNEEQKQRQQEIAHLQQQANRQPKGHTNIRKLIMSANTRE